MSKQFSELGPWVVSRDARAGVHYGGIAPLPSERG